MFCSLVFLSVRNQHVGVKEENLKAVLFWSYNFLIYKLEGKSLKEGAPAIHNENDMISFV